VRQHLAVGIQALHRGNACRPGKQGREEVQADIGIMRTGQHVALFTALRPETQPPHSRVGPDNYPEWALVSSPRVSVEELAGIQGGAKHPAFVSMTVAVNSLDHAGVVFCRSASLKEPSLASGSLALSDHRPFWY
jgi:hypothetical protein